MTPLQATELVYETVRTSWTGTTAANTSLENEAWTPPRDAASIRVIVQDLPGSTLTHGPTGDRVKRQPAIILAQIFVPRAIADGVAVPRQLAHTFSRLFQGAEIIAIGADYPNAISTAPAVIRAGRTDGDLYQQNVEVPFTYDELI